MSVKVLPMPRHVDDPVQVLLFTIDELVPLIIGIIAGIILNQTMICLLLGVVAAKAQRKYIDSMPDGFLFHLLYWTSLATFKARTLPHAFRRIWTA